MMIIEYNCTQHHGAGSPYLTVVPGCQVVRLYYMDRFWRIAPNYYMLLVCHLSMVLWLLLRQPKAGSREAKQVALYMLDGDIRHDPWVTVKSNV